MAHRLKENVVPFPTLPLPQTMPMLPSPGTLHYKVKPPHPFAGTRHESQANYSACDIVATLPRATRANYKAVATPIRQPIYPAQKFIMFAHLLYVVFFFFSFFFEGVECSLKGCGASVANRFDCFVGIVITSITYYYCYYCSDDVLCAMHTWNFHINFGNINGAHTYTRTHLYTSIGRGNESHISCPVRYKECRPYVLGWALQELSSIGHVTRVAVSAWLIKKN